MAVYRYGKKTSDINVQSDFNIKDTKSDAFIKNRPDSTLSIALDGVEQKKHYNPNTGSETINIDLSDTIIAQDNKLNNAIASLEVSRIGGSGKYISDVSEKDGKISATAVSTASTFSSTSTTAINGVGVNEALKTLDVAEVGEVGRYIEKIKETDGKISATLAVMDTTPTKDSKKAVTSSGVKAYIDDKISNLDVASVGGDGKYISAISEADGKITATVTSTNSTFSSTSTTAINGVGVNEALKTLNVAEVGSNGKYIQKIKEDNGKISATLKSFDTIISDESTDDNVPTSKAVNTKIFSEINKLNVDEVGEEGKYIEKILENSGKISTVVKAMDTTPTANSKKPVTSGGVKSYVDTQVNTEKTNRETAVTTVQTNLTTEIANRKSAIAALDSTSTLTAGNYYTGMTETNGIVTLSQSAMDTIPTANSKKPVTSGGVKSYVDSLNKSLVGEDGSYIKTIKEEKGIVTAVKQQFDTSISSTSDDKNAPTTKAVYDAIQSLGNVFHVRDSVETFSKLPSTGNTAGDVRNVNDTDDNYVWTGTKWDPLGGSSLIDTLNYSSPTASGTSTSFITSVSQSKGLITASKSNLPTASTSVVGIVKLNDAVNSTSTTTAATANAVKKVQDSVNTEVTNRTTAVSNVQSALTTEIANRKSAIAALDSTSTLTAGNYYTGMTETNGIVTLSQSAMDTIPTANSKKPVTSGGVKSYVDSLNKSLVGEDGSYIKTIKEEKGIVTAVKQQFDTSISSTSDDKNAPTTKAVYDAIQSLGNVFHVRDSVETFSKLPSTGNTAGDVRNVNDTDDNYVWTGTKWDPLGGSSLIDTLNYSSPTASGTSTSFITSVSQSKGLITASKSNLPTASTSVVGIVKLNDAVNSTSTTTAATANAVKKVQDSVNTEVTNRTTAVSNVQSALTTEIANRKAAITTEVTNRNTAISTAINALNKTSVGADGSYIKTISESKGIITATKQTFDTTISSDSTDNNTPTSKAVKDYVDSEISNLNTDLTTAINGKQASGNYKTTQTAVSSPAASGNATAFIDTISQNANGVITVTKKNVPSATQSVAGLMSAADKTKLDGLATHTTLSKTSTLSGMTKDEVYYINTTGIATTVSAITNMGIKLTFVTNVATTIKYYNTSGTLTTKSMDAGTVFFLFSCGSGYTPNLYGTVLDINPSSTSVGQIYIKTK